MNLLARATQYYKQARDLNAPISLDSNKDLKDIIVYIKNFLDGAGSVSNYRWYYEDFSELYKYISMKKQLPSRIVGDKYQKLLAFVNSIVRANAVSMQELLTLGMLWDAWSISNVAVLKDNLVRAMNNVIKRAIELMPR